MPDAGGVTFLPALAGLGAPHWRPDARGAFLGLGLGTSRAHLARAVAEGIAASVALLARAAAADRGAPLRVLRADGGLTRSRLLVQAQADLLQVPVQVCAAADATALGAAALARLGTGAASTLAEAVGQLPVEATIDPSIPAGPGRRTTSILRLGPRRRAAGPAMTGPAGRTASPTCSSSGPVWSAPPSPGRWPATS